MPPKKTPSAQNTLQRCSYREGNRRCPYSGIGNPPLCQSHQIAVAEQLAAAQRRADNPIGNLIGEFLAGRKISRETFYGAVGQVVGALGVQNIQIDAEGNVRAAHVEGHVRMPNQAPPRARRAPPPPPPPPVDPELEANLAARRVLGFGPNDRLSPEMVKKRRAELARKHHPDRGGSTDAMAKINDAADVLLGR